MPIQQEQTRQESSQTLLARFETLQRFEGPPDQFLRHLLGLQCDLASASAAAILRMVDRTNVQVLAIHPELNREGPDPVWLAQSAERAAMAVQAVDTIVAPLRTGAELYGQPAAQHLVLVPLHGGSGGVRGVAAYLLENVTPHEITWAKERLELTVGLISFFEMRLTLQQRNFDMTRLREGIEVLAAVNEQTRFRAAAMALCNELAARLKARRVSLGFLRGRYVKAAAVSHTEQFSRKMQLVQDIESAMEECIDQDVEVLYPVEGDASFINRVADELASRHGPESVCSLPLRKGGEPFAVVTIEREADEQMNRSEIETVRLICELCAARLSEMYEHDRWIGARMAASVRKTAALAIGPKYTWIKLAIIATMVGILFLTFVKGDDMVQAEFTIEPMQRQIVPAPFDGRLREVLVRPGDPVIAAETVLARFDTTELVLDRLQAQTEQKTYQDESIIAQRDNKPDEAHLNRLNAQKLQPRIIRLSEQIQQAEIKALISGTVISEDLRKNINAPFTKGDVLFEIAPIDILRAELLVPEDRITDLTVGQTGELASASHPGEFVPFEVKHIHPVAEVVEQNNIFRVEVEFTGEEKPVWLIPNTTGVAKVKVGRRAWGYILSREAINWVRMKLWI